MIDDSGFQTWSLIFKAACCFLKAMSSDYGDS